MCGIAGICNWNGPADEEAVRQMCKRLAHRGPDDEGILSLGNVALGHRRLSIIDLTQRAHQPMASSDNRFYIVYNGEVYNFKELKSELQNLGVNFNSESDTEVLLYAYIRWGAACLNKFNGMFALAIWDNVRKELFLARDRFGKKPLYYYLGSRGIVFASELSALVCDREVPRNISYEALNCYLALGYILSPRTFYRGVFKLESATYMLIRSPGKIVKKECYWDYAALFRTKTRSDDRDIADNILELLKASVKRRMVSDVPVGAFLSGGIDSSSVASLAKRYHTGDLHTFSIGFEEERYNELDDADRAAGCIGTIHHSRICRVDEELRVLNEAIGAYDEPFADNSLVPTVELARFTSSYVKVALSGDGADEIFAGYITYKADRYYRYARRVPLFMRRKLFDVVEGLELEGGGKIRAGYKGRKFLYGSLFGPEKAHYAWRLIFTPQERIAILGERHRELVYHTDPFFTFKKYYDRVEDLDWLDRHLYVDAMTWLTDDILVKVDRASMRSGIEARCPYLDVDLASYAASIPSRLKMNGLETKYILKVALKKILPEFIIHKKKSGFNAPAGAWLKSGGNDEFKSFNKYVFDHRIKVAREDV